MIKEEKDINIINLFLKIFSVEIQEINNFDKYFIMNINNSNIAIIAFSHIYERIELNYIYVNNDYRKKGIASKLMNKMISYAKEQKCNNITLEVNEKNNSAIKLYKKFNFKSVALRKNYYGKDNGLLMMKEMI